ncbi:TonB-dependent receptor [Weeksellaceae bacterium TAE3-ERU29]|nr:TonB-dependent receptor [Weeksellaceae bacterium TAE3-ERU29]
MKFKYILLIIASITITNGLNAKSIEPKIENDTIILPHIKIKGNKPLKTKIDMKSSLNQKEIEKKHSLSLGDLLSEISGVQDTYFGPGSGSPMIRSLSGNRVKVLNNGVSIADLSGISPEYNVSFGLTDIQEIDVNKNSSSVLYGGKAIGGAVNLVTNVIPHKMADKTFGATVNLEGSSNSGTKQAANLYGNIGKHLSWNAGFSSAFIKRIRIPGRSKVGFMYDPKTVNNREALQALGQVWLEKESVFNISLFPYINPRTLEDMKDPSNGLSEGDQYTFDETYFNPPTFTYEKNLPNPDYIPGQDQIKDRYIEKIKNIHDYVTLKDKEIPNSHSDLVNFNAGLSYIGDDFSIGGAYQRNYSSYGVPIFAKAKQDEHTHSHGGHSHKKPKIYPYEPVSIKNFNDNFSLKADINKNILIFQNIKVNGLAQISINKEYIGDYAESRYDIKNYGSRIELQQKTLENLSGTIGAEYNNRTIDGEYNIRYLPDNQSSDFGIFTVQNLNYAFANLQLGYRYGIANRKVIEDKNYKRGRGRAGGKLQERNYDLHQFSSRLLLNVAEKAYLLASYAHSERAPEVNELYAGNNHYSIGIEENGDDKLNKEFVNSVEIGGGISLYGLKIDVNLYKNFYRNYIYLGHTGIGRNGLVVKEWRASDTDIYGMELNAKYTYDFGNYGEWSISGFYDLVKNENISDNSQRKFTDGDYMPNMPTSRFGFGLDGKVNKFEINIGAQHYLEQKYLGKMLFLEIPMPEFTMLDARVSYNSEISNIKTEYYVFGKNLLNQEARPQNSLMKYLSPLPGINIGAGVKFKL